MACAGFFPGGWRGLGGAIPGLSARAAVGGDTHYYPPAPPQNPQASPEAEGVGDRDLPDPPQRGAASAGPKQSGGASAERRLAARRGGTRRERRPSRAPGEALQIEPTRDSAAPRTGVLRGRLCQNPGRTLRAPSGRRRCKPMWRPTRG